MPHDNGGMESSGFETWVSGVLLSEQNDFLMLLNVLNVQSKETQDECKM